MLAGQRSSAVAIADLNRDRFPELIVANRYRPLKHDPGDHRELDTDVESNSISSFVYWGSIEDYSEQRRMELPTVSASSVAAGDLNGDGFPELVFTNGPQRAGHSAPGLGIGSAIYWNGPRGFEIHRRTLLPTLNATDCLIEDLNQDGYSDLVFSNENDARSFDTPSYIYWGDPHGFDVKRRLELPTIGAASVGMADFNRDGKKDLVFVNRIDGSAGQPIPAYVYWGNEKGDYRVDQRLDLYHPFGSPGEGYSSADLNNDGWVDLYMGGPESAVYWGGPEGLSSGNKNIISSTMAFSARIADFNQDGYLDLILSEYATGGGTNLYWGGPMGFSSNHRFTFQVDGVRFQSISDLNSDGYLDVVFPTVHKQVVIFWNSQSGFDSNNRSTLPSGLSVVTEIADLNQDDQLDLIISNLQSETGDPQGDVFIYWGATKGYEPSNMQRLPALGPEGSAVADLNRDGYLDIAISSYHAGETRSHPSYIYWNSADGSHSSHVTHLPTHSASGVMAADFNQDDFPDLLFACHKMAGAHRNDSYLYWGGPQGFSADRRSLLPGLGPHLLAGADIGNIFDRKDRYTYVSKVFDAGSLAQFETLSWDGETPFATSIQFQVRGANSVEALRQSKWKGPEGEGSFYIDRHSKLKGLLSNTRYFQFKATLVGPNGASTPVLRSTSIGYR